MKKPKQGGWFRQRAYPHLDFPVSFNTAEKLATNPASVAKHAFLPLIGYSDVRRTFRTDNSNRSIPRRQRPKRVGSKSRDIKYASHSDAAIFSYYAFLLQTRYEEWLSENELGESVIGYRAGLGSNIDLAAAVFAEVAARSPVTCLCFDISDFFPSIPHRALKAGLKMVLDVLELPDDWYNVFRNVTKHSWVDLKEISVPLGFNPTDAPSPLVSDIGSAMATLRGAKLVHINANRAGIPQGTPISAVFANVAMAQFDIDVLTWAKAHGIVYRRYSDDILLLVPSGAETAANAFLPNLAASMGLTINSAKTEVSRFSGSNPITVDRPLTYLGFTFDGERVSLRARTLSRYYRRMTYAVRGTIRGAGRKGQPSSKAFRRTLYRDVTHLGRGSFYAYAARAHGKFQKSIVKRQLRRHFKILLRKLSNRGR